MLSFLRAGDGVSPSRLGRGWGIKRHVLHVSRQREL